MKIAVIGVGGVGGYFGARLAQAGNEVTFIARGRQLAALRQSGLRVKSVGGDFHLERVRATDSLVGLKETELVLLGVKAWQVKEIGRRLSGVIGDNTTVLPLQNGIMAAEELGEVVESSRVIGGLCRIISRIESPGVILHSGVTPYIAIGELDHRLTERVRRIRETLLSAGLQAVIAENIHTELWMKFMAICVSGLLAITRSSYGVVRELKETRSLMTELLWEIDRLARSAGIPFATDAVEKTLALIDSYPYGMNSSLTRDVLEGRPSEIEYQNGSVVRLAERYQIPVPVNRFIYSTILPMEIEARKRAEETASSPA